MPADLGSSAYLVDAVDLADATAELTHDGAGLWSGPAEEVGTDTYPGADGGDITGGLFRPYTLSTMYTVRAPNPTAVWAAAVALRRRCKPGRTVTLTRRMPDPDGTDANTDHTTTARRLTDRPIWLAKTGLTLDVDWWVTSPWYGPTVTIPNAAGTQTILGDTRTYRILITLSAGAQRTVANNTPGNGYYFQFVGASVPSGGAVVDVKAKRATAVVGGANLTQYLRWPKNFPFRLDEGPNLLATDVGTFDVAYQPVYL